MQLLRVVSLLCACVALAGGQPNATLSIISVIPCNGTILETVSLYKSDIYTVENNLTFCKLGGSWNPNATNGLRVSVQAVNATEEFPVVFVARQQKDGVLSWTLPLKPEGFTTIFYQANRTVCPSFSLGEGDLITRGGSTQIIGPLFFIDVFSSSEVPINYSMSIDAVEDFELKVGMDPYLFIAGADAPQIRYVKFPNDSEVLTVQADTEDNKCAFISVQNNSCPVNDLLETARSKGIYQTMSTSAFLTVRAKEFKEREFLLIVITTNYSLCHSTNYRLVLPANETGERFEQILAVQVKRLPPPSEFLLAIFLPILVFAVVWIFGLTIPFLCLPQVHWTPPFGCAWVRGTSEDQSLLDGAPSGGGYSTMLETQEYSRNRGGGSPSVNDDSGSEEEGRSHKTDVDRSLEISAKQETDESKLKLPRMCKRSHDKMQDSYSVYSWNTVTVGIFYALPAFQLVLSEQQILNSSGNQDQCYYNFKCAYPLGVLSAFNNVWSNVGYVLLGILFILVIFIRKMQYDRRRENNKVYFMTHGVPQYFGIYYAMGIGLIMEGFMSAFYHICPTNANFQFDTAFMFIIGGLFLVKVFQNRHPDIHANAFIAFFSFAVIIFFTLLGLYFDRINPIAIRLIIFILMLGLVLMFFVSFYNFHTWTLGKASILRIIRNIKSYFTTCPMHKSRFFKLFAAFLLNVFLAVLVVALWNHVDIATAVLAFFLVNLLYFLVIYTLQKLYYREPLTILPLVLPAILALLWGFAFWFFFHNVSNWKVTPAESRELNRECIVLGFYDEHDIWHFLSASAMFFSFLFLLVLDDGLVNVKREDIHIF